MDGSSLASWDTAEQSVVTWSEVMMQPTMVELPLVIPNIQPAMDRLPLALPNNSPSDRGVQPTTNHPPLCAFQPLDRLNKKVCPTNIVYNCRQRFKIAVGLNVH